MTEKRLDVEDLDGVRILTLRREKKKNAFDFELADQLWNAIETADQDDAVRVVLVTAAGDYFTGGADINMFLQAATLDPAQMKRVATLYEAIAGCTKPTIALIQGHAVGMGVTMLPHFDLVYAAEGVTFMTPFVKLGLVQEFASSFTLSRLIGVQRAKELILRAAPIDAKTAGEWGLVTRVFAADDARANTLKIAADIAANPPGAVTKAKRLIDEGLHISKRESIRAEDDVLATLYGSPENIAAVTAILSRKK